LKAPLRAAAPLPYKTVGVLVVVDCALPVAGPKKAAPSAPPTTRDPATAAASVRCRVIFIEFTSSLGWKTARLRACLSPALEAAKRFVRIERG
jgi:hypothetical protein